MGVQLRQMGKIFVDVKLTCKLRENILCMCTKKMYNNYDEDFASG